MAQMVPSEERLLARRSIDSETGCWNYTGSIFPNGYGQFYFDGMSRGAHRVAYILWRGPIPDGLVIDHLCRNPRCFNPDHLEAVSQRENTMRGDTPARKNAAKEVCIRGHNNWRVVLNRGTLVRSCRTCMNEQKRAYRAAGRMK